MKHGSILPALGLLIAASAAFGLQLGESAVEEIDPVYFRGPAIHPRDRGAAIDTRALSEPAAPRFASLYGWEEGSAARAENCEDCDAFAGADAHRYPAEIEWEETAGEAMDEAAAYLEDAERRWVVFEEDEADRFGQERAAVERYARYPVTAEEAEAAEEEDSALVYYSDPAEG